MADEMYFSNNERALLRGKRRLKRTETCRPCLVHVQSDDTPIEGVVLDVTPYGMMVRMIDTLSLGTKVRLQLMRDDNFREPLGAEKQGEIVRHDPAAPPGFTDHGVRMVVSTVPKNDTRSVDIRGARQPGRSHSSRMHNIDFTVGVDRKGRGG